MKKNDFVQIKGLDLKELKGKLNSLKSEISNLTLDKNMKKLKDLKMVSKKKKELARVLTLIKQKETLGQIESRVESLESSEEEVKNQESKIRKGKTSL